MRQGFQARWPRAVRRLAALMLVAAGWMTVAPAWADPPGRVGRIAETHGVVWIYAPEQQEWVQAEVNRPLTSGDRLAVDRGARAEVAIGSTTLRLAGDTELSFTELDDARMQLQLQQGTLAARLRDPVAANQFEVDTPEGRVTPLQPGHFRVDIDDDETLALAWSGQLRFDASDSSLTVPAGRRAELWREDGATHYTWADMPDDDFADWVLAADRRDEFEAARERYVPQEMTGWEDLDRAGRWESTTEFGTLWIPIQVAPDWAPYRQGHWSWVAPWGWTWVDDAPWGFAPFHYGRWVWWGNHWCWSPGAYVARPVYAPALVAWVGASPAIAAATSPVVGWVPLAPGEVYYPGYPIGRGHWHALNPHAPLNAYRPTPPSRATANFINRRAPGGVTLMPAARWHQPQHGNTVPVAEPVRGGQAHLVSPTLSTALTLVSPPRPPHGAAVGNAGGANPATPGPRRGLPFVRPPHPGTSQSPLSAAAHAPTVPPSPLSQRQRPSPPRGEVTSTTHDRPGSDATPRPPAARIDPVRRAPHVGDERDEVGRTAHRPGQGGPQRPPAAAVSTRDLGAMPPSAPPGFVRRPHVPPSDADGARHEPHRVPAPPPVQIAPPPAGVSPLSVQPMRPAAPAPQVRGAAPHAPGAAPAHPGTPARPSSPGRDDERVPAPQQRAMQP
jgi:hypothetical protein